MDKNRRRKILAHKDMQLRIISQVLIMVASGMLLVGGAVYLIIWQGITSPAFASGQISIISIFDQVHKLLFIVIPALILIMGWIAIIISHRIAGPLVNLNNGMRSLESGQWPERPMKFRKGDEGHYLAEQFNVMTQSVREMVSKEQETAKMMMSEMEDYSQKLQKEQKVDREIIDKLNQMQERFKKLSQKGFTLIELMIVVVIIGILAAIAVPNYINMRHRALEASTKSNMHTLQLVVEDFAARSDGYYPDNLDTRLSAIDPALVASSIAEGVRVPPFPANALICPHLGYVNPFNAGSNALDNLPGGPPAPAAGPSGDVFYTSYDIDGNLNGGAIPAARGYRICGYGKTAPVILILNGGTAN